LRIGNILKVNDESANSGNEKKSILKDWKSDDKKLLIITIAATVAANVITVIIVALAIIIARYFRPHPATPVSYAVLLSASTIPLTIILIALSARSDAIRTGSTSGKIVKWIMTIIAIAAGFLTFLVLLGWVGFALGVK
jgi:hypothetical protein